MSLFSGLFTDSVGFMSVFTLAVLIVIPLIVAKVIISGMKESKR